MHNEITFSDLNLPTDILQAINNLGFQHPTDIQREAIPHLIAGNDVVGVAQTGTGKTAAFGLPMLTHVLPAEKNVQALVLAPTRELALQGAAAIRTFAAQTAELNVVAVYGGSAYGPQLSALKDGAQVVVGTPGRIMDLMDRGALKLAHVRYFVLDEADEMLRMGFAEDVEKIAGELPDERVSALFSATMPKAIRNIATAHLHDPIEITITPAASTVDTIEQTFAVVPNRHKIGALSRVLATSSADAALVFVRTRATAEELSLELTARGVHAAALSGDVAQTEREKLVNRLRSGFLDVLVATDVAARGLDVERIGLVVNFDVPREIDTYVHRIGRTGRAGREGLALTFVTPKERSRLRKIEAVTKSKMSQVELPTPAEVSAYRAQKLIQQAETRYHSGRLWVYEEVLSKYLSQDSATNDPEKINSEGEKLSEKQLLLALMALAVRDFGPQESDNEPDILTAKFEDSARDDAKQSRRRKESGKARTFDGIGTMYRVEVGKRDGVKPGSIVGAITGESGLNSSQLGRIDIYPSFSIVEFADELDEKTLRKIARAKVQGRALAISRDRGPGGTKSKHLNRDLQRRTKSDREHEYTEAQTRKYRADKKFGQEKRARLESMSRDERRSGKQHKRKGKFGSFAKHNRNLTHRGFGKHSS
ncbi:DEAD/DEAH box helicase [Arcanobacterium hippocoleae]|uniref:ATP-dependent RNA helicase DeaD n=1 Tax=Arcanobacterium hippocoleae TaxID=149017 RepID=A0ABU1T027_9ACTO|nr:DEAD/DEAH box helicase [Arcanobacterium hippocoleae]MDR6938739.1 ATP-dependent RNA helicase DeaD [Arcanobacterium hippocoleae]